MPPTAGAGGGGTDAMTGGSNNSTAGQPAAGASASAAGGTQAMSPAAGAGGGANAGQAAGGAAGAAGAGPVSQASLTIYWIDVEGGASTLLIAPNGQVIVVDAGFPGARDAGRIAQVLKDEVHADHIDHFITTHYHNDHIGGVPTLATLIPISKFYDHGATVEPSSDFDNYVATAGDERVLGKPGDKITAGTLELTFVTAAEQVIEPALPTAIPNPLCPSNIVKTMDAGPENTESLGFIARFGSFDFIDLGDLTWKIEQKLMCPTNRIGIVDLFQVSHHGQDVSNSPQLIHALAPTVAVMNNGAVKGGAAASFDTLKASPGLKDLWSLHHVNANDAEHNAEDALTANLAGADSAYSLKAVVESNGAYTLTNARTGMSRTYASR